MLERKQSMTGTRVVPGSRRCSPEPRKTFEILNKVAGTHECISYISIHNEVDLLVKINMTLGSVAYAGKNFGGGSRLWPASWGVRGAEPPGLRKIFENLQIKFLKKIAKNELF